MKVVQHQHQGLALGDALHKGSYGVKQSEPGCLRFYDLRRFEVSYLVMDLRNHIGDIGRAVAHRGLHLAGATLLNVGADGLGPGPVDTIEPPCRRSVIIGHF